MALKILKINIPLELKGDPQDKDDLRDRIYETLQILMEDEELDFVIDEDDYEEVDEE